MKINFKKVSAIAASALMVGMTMGTAVAANYPAPFISGGSASVAVVYGTGAGVSSSDLVQAGNVQSNLQSYMTGSTTTSGATTTGGDSYKIELASTKFQLGKGVTSVVSGTITDDHLPTLLEDGKYTDSDNNEKSYTQKLTLSNWTLGMFDDSDYARDTPTIGLKIASGAPVLNYTFDFTTNPNWDKLATTDIHLLNKDYYILSTNSPTNTTITLLDSASSTLLEEGAENIVEVGEDSYKVSIDFIGSNQVKLKINDESTTTLAAGNTYKLSDGAYVGIKSILYTAKESGISKVELSIGSGKLALTNTQNVEINDETISGLNAYFGGSGAAALTDIVIEWKADGDLFIAPNSDLEMPGFDAVKISWGEMTLPKEEVITIEDGSTDYMVLKDFPLKDSSEDIEFISGNNSDYKIVGKASDSILRTVGSGNLTFDGDTDEYFVASWTDSGSNAESYLMRAANFKQVSSVNKTTIQYKKDGSWVNAKEDAVIGDVITLGSTTLTVGAIDNAGRTVVIQPGTGVSFNTLYSKEGMKVYLPWVNSTAQEISNTTAVTCAAATYKAGQIGPVNVTNVSDATSSVICYATTFKLVMNEEDRTGTIGNSNNINVTLGWNTATTKQAYISDIEGESVTFAQQESTKIWESYVYSPLATQILWDKSGDQYTAKLTYHGEESYGNVFVSSPEATITAGTTTAGGQLGDVLVEDSEVSSVSSKNLIVVGGSCINSVAAKLLGAAACGASFTTATGVGTGQFLIQSFADAYTTGKVALLVAGYDAADTVNAVTYLKTKTVDTTAGKKYKGTSATTAELVTTSE